MLTDHWIIILLIGQLSSFIIFSVSFFYAMQILFKWNIADPAEGQLLLERKTYLVSVILHYVLAFQLILLVLFIEIINNHLPELINGAMCAQGILYINNFGFPALYVKIASLLVYSGFLFVNFLDQSEPYYPLTPGKYKVMPLLFLLITLDLILTVQFFYQIEPDVIATCCSISFTPSISPGQGILESYWTSYINLPLYYLITLLLLTLFLYFYKHVKWLLGITIIYILIAVGILKEHFVRYIYARPTHNCLFDIFWRDYYFVGYLLYGLLFSVIILVVFMNIFVITQKKLKKEYNLLNNKFRYLAITSLILYTIIIHLYWLNWVLSY